MMPDPVVSPEKIPAYILCGGQSRRFGSDKARALIGPDTLLQRVISQLQPHCTDVWLVAEAADKYRDLHPLAIVDDYPGCGPLAGLHAACGHLQQSSAESGWLLLASCDQTEIQPDWLQDLVTARQTPGCAAVVFAEAGDSGQVRRHPFPGLFHACLEDRLQECLETRRLSVQAFLDRLEHSAELVTRPCPPEWPAVPQINTPADWRAWQHTDPSGEA